MKTIYSTSCGSGLTNWFGIQNLKYAQRGMFYNQRVKILVSMYITYVQIKKNVCWKNLTHILGFVFYVVNEGFPQAAFNILLWTRSFGILFKPTLVICKPIFQFWNSQCCLSKNMIVLTTNCSLWHFWKRACNAELEMRYHELIRVGSILVKRHRIVSMT